MIDQISTKLSQTVFFLHKLLNNIHDYTFNSCSTFPLTEKQTRKGKNYQTETH